MKDSNMTRASLALVRSARGFAACFRSQRVGMEHLVLAMLSNPNISTFQLLARMVHDFSSLRQALVDCLEEPQSGKTLSAEELPLNDELESAIEKAEAEQQLMNHPGKIDAPHLLLGVLNLRTSKVAQVFDNIEVGLERARHQVLLMNR